MEKGYAGWTNYETWNVALHINNDQGTQAYWQERAKEVDSVAYLADELQESHENAIPDELTGSLRDILNEALSEVNWHEIARSLLDDAQDA
jgi:hypothetical protein